MRILSTAVRLAIAQITASGAAQPDGCAVTDVSGWSEACGLTSPSDDSHHNALPDQIDLVTGGAAPPSALVAGSSPV